MYFLFYLALFFHFSIYATPPYLQDPNENKIREIISCEIPELIIDSLKINSSGCDNLIAEINDEWIFRFPVNQENAELLVREHLLLDYLQSYIGIEIPFYCYIGQNISFAQYRKIMGDPLSRDHYDLLQDEQQQDVANSLALFIAQLHSAVSIEQALSWEYKTCELSLASVEELLQNEHLGRKINRGAKEALNYAKAQNIKYQVLLHKDLHGGNIAYDPFSKKLKGVFDFSDAAIGDYSIEFGNLFGIHEDLAVRTAKAYSRLTQKPNPTLPALADYILRRTLSLLRARETGDKARELHLTEKITRLVTVWDVIKKNEII